MNTMSVLWHENVNSIMTELKETTKGNDTWDTPGYDCTSVELIKHVGSAVHCRF